MGSVGVDDLVAEAITDAVARFDADDADVVVLEARDVTWRDSSLGCPAPGISYLQRLTEGFLVVLRIGARRVEYHHSGPSGPARFCQEPATTVARRSAGLRADLMDRDWPPLRFGRSRSARCAWRRDARCSDGSGLASASLWPLPIGSLRLAARRRSDGSGLASARFGRSRSARCAWRRDARVAEHRRSGSARRSVDERPRDSSLEFGRVALHAVRQICGLPAQDGIEPEQHDRRERIEQLGSADPEPGGEVDQAAPIEQVHPPTVELVALEVSSNRGARMTVEPVDVDLAVAVADVDEDRAVGDLRQLLARPAPRRTPWR